jgi:hypothetical protein
MYLLLTYESKKDLSGADSASESRWGFWWMAGERVRLTEFTCLLGHEK